MEKRRLLFLSVFCILFPDLLLLPSTQAEPPDAGLAEFANVNRDATEALQAAFDRNRVVRIPSGVFRFSRPLRITHSGATIIGAPGSVLALTPGKTNNGILVGPPPDKRDAIGSVRDVRLVNLTLRNAPENYDWKRNTGTGIELWGVYGARIENCRVRNFVHDGIGVRVSREVLVSGCEIRGGRHGISLWGHYQGGKWGARDIRITACQISEAWDTGIAVGFFCDDVAITGCVIRDARCHGIDIFHATNVTVTGNVIRDWLSTKFPDAQGRVAQAVGVFIHTDWGVRGAWRIPTADIVVTGNTLTLTHGTFPKNCRPGCIEITGNVSGVTVTGNTITGGQMALAMNGMRPPDPADSETPAPVPRNVLVADNVFRGQTDLLWIGGSRPEVHGMIANNVFAPAPGAGVHLDQALTGLIFQGNLFRGGTFSGPRPKGTVWRGNVFAADAPSGG